MVCEGLNDGERGGGEVFEGRLWERGREGERGEGIRVLILS